MKMNLSVRFATLLLIAAVSFTACKKEGSQQATSVNQEEAQTMSQENAAAEAEYDDITEMGLSAGSDMESIEEAQESGNRLILNVSLFVDLQYKLGPCATITSSDSTYPKTVTIDFGDGCVCRDGKFRKGIVELTFSGPIRQSGSVLTITLKDYYVNRAHIEGTKIITNLSAGGAVKYSVEVKDGKITWPNGRGFAFVGVKTVTQINGSSTRTVRDDIYSIEGRTQTTYNNGVVVVKNTESALIKPVTCPFIVKGKVKISINDRVLYIDFGTGDCDNKALLIWANGQVEIRL